MKKSIITAVALAMALSLSACGGSGGGSGEADVTTAANAETVKDETTAEETTTETITSAISTSATEAKESSDFKTLNEPDGGIAILKYVGTNPDVVIPDEIDGKSVVRITPDAFSGAELETLKIPESVNKIGKSAFESCKNLKSVNIPENLTEIDDYTFCECKSLTAIVISNGVSRIGNNAFAKCENLTEITIPNGILEIGSEAFAGSGLTEITIPNGVTIIGAEIFSGCNDLKKVNLPDDITYIRGNWFGNKITGNVNGEECTVSIDDYDEKAMDSLNEKGFVLMMAINAPEGIVFTYKGNEYSGDNIGKLYTIING